MEQIDGNTYYDSNEFRKMLKRSVLTHSHELKKEIDLEKKYINNQIAYV